MCIRDRFYLYYERKYATRALGGFVLLVVTSAVVFLLWYSFTRDAGQIQPLVPALKSWWMKLHVPANFIGYGTFSLAAMVGFAYLVKQHGQTSSWLKLAPLFVLGVLLLSLIHISSSRRAAAAFRNWGGWNWAGSRWPASWWCTRTRPRWCTDCSSRLPPMARC